MKKPRARVFPPLTDEQRALARQQREDWDREIQERWDANVDVRRRLLAAGPPLRDVEAALKCHDSCHPTVNVLGRCEGGTTCPCQDTPEEAEARKAQQLKWLDELSEIGHTPEEDARLAAERETFETTAASLAVDVRSWGGAAPFQMEGVVDGLSFYVRERHQSYRVEVAPADNPMLLVSNEPHGQGELEIADGPDVDLYEGDTGFDVVNALVNTVTWIRDFQRREGCSHILTNEAGSIQFRFCPICGMRTQDVTGFKQ